MIKQESAPEAAEEIITVEVTPKSAKFSTDGVTGMELAAFVVFGLVFVAAIAVWTKRRTG